MALIMFSGLYVIWRETVKKTAEVTLPRVTADSEVSF